MNLVIMIISSLQDKKYLFLPLIPPPSFEKVNWHAHYISLMKRVKELIKQVDLFEHTNLLRYQQQPSYRTLTGGIFSIVLYGIFIGLFSRLVIDTFNYSIISDSTNISFDTQPTSFQLKPSVKDKFMFAVGITGLDMTSQRYFDLKLENFTSIKNTSGTFRTSTTVPLVPCSISQWDGINSQITNAYQTLNFSQWLCPPTDYVFPLQGKFTSNTFQYARLLVLKCGTNSNSSTCADSTEVTNFLTNNQGATLNFYFTNTLINSGSEKYLDYYLQDRNYFAFDTATGVNANLFFSEYKIQTDNSAFPWADKSEDSGARVVEQANRQTFSVTSNSQYAKIHLRKSSERFDITRSFAKIDETLAYIGGMLSFLLLILTFMNFYTKFCFEIEFGDKIFKQNNNGSFGSQHFNFVVFLGYSIYNILTEFGIYLKWKTMKKYHDCRIQCIKQLDINLLFKKIEFLQEVANVVLQDHHIQGLFMIPKKKLKDAQKSRRRFMLQTIIYHQLDRKAQEVNIESVEYQKRYQQFLKEHEHIQEQHKEKNDKKLGEDNGQAALKVLKKQCETSYNMLKSESHGGEKYSKKILDKLSVKSLTSPMNDGQKNSFGNVDPPLNPASNFRLERCQNDDYLQPYNQYLEIDITPHPSNKDKDKNHEK